MSNWIRLLSIAAVSMAATTASAQVREGAVKLSVDTNFFNYNRTLVEEGEYSQTDTALSFGPMPATGGLIPGYVGLSAGYVVMRHLIPQLQLGFGVTKLKSESEPADEFSSDGDGPRLSELMLRPMLEVPINPDSRFVVSGIVGLDYRLLKYKYESDGVKEEEKTRGIGPVLGLVSHFFVIERASIDLGALFSYNALKQELEDESGSSDPDPDKHNSITLGLTLGLSLWPGPDNSPKN